MTIESLKISLEKECERIERYFSLGKVISLKGTIIPGWRNQATGRMEIAETHSHFTSCYHGLKERKFRVDYRPTVSAYLSGDESFISYDATYVKNGEYEVVIKWHNTSDGSVCPPKVCIDPPKGAHVKNSSVLGSLCNILTMDLLQNKTLLEIIPEIGKNFEIEERLILNDRGENLIVLAIKCLGGHKTVVSLNRDRGFLLERMDKYHRVKRDSADLRLSSTIEVFNSVKMSGEEYWMPTEIKTRGYDEEGECVGRAVTISDLSWRNIQDSQFEYTFPPGSDVWDYRTRLRFTVGETPEEARKNVREIVADNIEEKWKRLRNKR